MEKTNENGNNKEEKTGNKETYTMEMDLLNHQAAEEMKFYEIEPILGVI